jgi:hypothetical protein
MIKATEPHGIAITQARLVPIIAIDRQAPVDRGTVNQPESNDKKTAPRSNTPNQSRVGSPASPAARAGKALAVHSERRQSHLLTRRQRRGAASAPITP